MTFQEAEEQLGLQLNDPMIKEAAIFLEDRGYRFCIDFGTDNAVAVAGAWIAQNDEIWSESFAEGSD